MAIEFCHLLGFSFFMKTSERLVFQTQGTIQCVPLFLKPLKSFELYLIQQISLDKHCSLVIEGEQFDGSKSSEFTIVGLLH